MDRKRILLIVDQYGWGGYVRAQYIQEYLNDEFQIDIMDMNEFGEYEEKYPNTKKYDLYYPLFHTMMVTQKIQRMLLHDIKMITIVTGFPTIKPIFKCKDHTNNFDRLSKYLLAIGANNYKSLNDLKKHYNGNTFYAPRGTDEHIFYPLSNEPKSIDDDFVVSYVGKPVPEKGLSIIKEACKRAGVKLIMNTRNFTNALSPNEMREFYNKSDLYIVASVIDGSPNTALEAAACGKPIISNHIGNMPEFIKNGYNGFMIAENNERNINKYVYWLKRLKSDRELCFEMGMNARKTILENWTWEKVLNQYERNIFREMIYELQGSK